MMENLIYKWIITGVPPFSETSILQKMKLHRWTWRESGSITQQEFKIGTFCVTGVAWSDSLYSTMTTVGPSIFKMLIPHILPTNDWYRKDLTFGMKARKKGDPKWLMIGDIHDGSHIIPYGSIWLSPKNGDYHQISWFINLSSSSLSNLPQRAGNPLFKTHPNDIELHLFSILDPSMSQSH